MNKIKRFFTLSKRKIISFALITLVVCFISFVSFSILYFYHQGTLIPRFSRVQRFSQEELYENLFRFDLLDNNIIRSNYINPRIIVSIDPERAGDRLFIEIEHLSVDSTDARVFFAREGEEFNSERSVRYTLANGLNTIHLPYGNYARLRIDLARLPDISMAVTSVIFANRDFLTAVFWLHFFILLTLNLAIVFMLFYAFSATRKVKIIEQKTKPIYIILEKLLYTITAAIIPSIFLFNLYNRNRDRGHIYFENTVIWALLFLVLSVALFCGIYWLMRNLECALLILVLYWVAFWFFGMIHSSIVEHTIYMPRLLLLSLIGLLLSVVCVLLQRLRSLFGDMHLVFRTLALVLCGLFISNFSPGLRDYIVAREATSRHHNTHVDTNISQSWLPYIRNSFNLDPNLLQPDIYWFFTDGLMSLETVERLFGYSHDSVREELECRGFIIYDDATLTTIGTSIGMAAIFSPGFYDEYLGELLDNVSNYLMDERISKGSEILRADGIRRWALDVLSHNEMYRALMLAGYDIIKSAVFYAAFTQSPHHRFYSLGSDDFPLTYNLQNNLQRQRLMTGELAQLLALTTPLFMFLDQEATLSVDTMFFPMPSHSERLPDFSSVYEMRLYRNLIDSFSVSSPKFVFNLVPFTHVNWWHLHDPGSRTDHTRYYLYPAAYSYAHNVLLNAIDMVLDENPEAVIVIQSDHGFHSSITISRLLELGYTHEQLIELQDSVFSAVRIPSQYGGLDAPIAPLNISRELINRFVGENYELIP